MQKVFQQLKSFQYSFGGKTNHNASYIRYQKPNKPVKSNINLKNSVFEVNRIREDMNSSELFYYDKKEGKLFFKNDNRQFTVKLNLEVDEYAQETNGNGSKIISKTKIGNSAIDRDFLKLFSSFLKKAEKN